MVNEEKLKAALKKLEKIKDKLENALKYADYAWHRGGVGEKRNMLSLMNVAKMDANAAILLMNDVESIMWEDEK